MRVKLLDLTFSLKSFAAANQGKQGFLNLSLHEQSSFYTMAGMIGLFPGRTEVWRA